MGMLGTLSTANAQSTNTPVLQPNEVTAIARSIGLDPASQPVLRGPVYVLRAVDFDNTLVRVTVSASSGRVLNILQISPPQMAKGEPRRVRPHHPLIATAPPKLVQRPHAIPMKVASARPASKSVRPAAADITGSISAARSNGYRPARWIPVPIAPD
jgi:hypothetical protein